MTKKSAPCANLCNYNPPPRIQKAIWLFLTSTGRMGLSEACRLAGVHRNTYYYHFQKTKFQEWLEQQRVHFMMEFAGSVLHIYRKGLEKGNAAILRLYEERCGLIPFSRVPPADPKVIIRYFDRNGVETTPSNLQQK